MQDTLILDNGISLKWNTTTVTCFLTLGKLLKITLGYIISQFINLSRLNRKLRNKFPVFKLMKNNIGILNKIKDRIKLQIRISNPKGKSIKRLSKIIFNLWIFQSHITNHWTNQSQSDTNISTDNIVVIHLTNTGERMWICNVVNLGLKFNKSNNCPHAFIKWKYQLDYSVDKNTIK